MLYTSFTKTESPTEHSNAKSHTSLVTKHLHRKRTSGALLVILYQQKVRKCSIFAAWFEVSDPVGCRREQPVFFDVWILPVRVVEGALYGRCALVVERVMVPSAEAKVSPRMQRYGTFQYAPRDGSGVFSFWDKKKEEQHLPILSFVGVYGFEPQTLCL